MLESMDIKLVGGNLMKNKIQNSMAYFLIEKKEKQ